MISEPILGIIMLCLMIFAIFIGFPVAFTLMALGVLFGFPSMGWTVFDLMVQRSFAVMNNDVLVSLPLFMLMGYVMERAGIMDRMFHSYRLLFGPLPGAIALATMFVGTIFGIASGIVGAGVTLMGVLALPPMLRAGYSVELAAGTITSTGTLGILIPPSVMLIVYAATAGVSIVKIYAGAFGPGFLMSVRLTGRTTAMVCWLFVGASLFAAVFARLGAQAKLEEWVLGFGLGPNGFL